MSSSLDFNHIQYPYYEEDPKDDSEKHLEPHNAAMQTCVKDEGHPLFSTKGLLNLVNIGRAFGNAINEKELTGEIKIKVIDDTMKAAKQTGFPVDILYVALDWKKDLTARSDASDAKEIANKMKNYIPTLRSSLGRDPLLAEIFAAFVLNDAAKVKTIYDNMVKAPEDKAPSPGSDKDSILLFKNRNNKPDPRTNRELYEYFYKRVINGKRYFIDYMGKNNGI